MVRQVPATSGPSRATPLARGRHVRPRDASLGGAHAVQDVPSREHGKKTGDDRFGVRTSQKFVHASQRDSRAHGHSAHARPKPALQDERLRIAHLETPRSH